MRPIAQAEMIVKLWAEGRSASQIAAEIGGGLTKNGVCGFAARNRDLCPARDRIAATIQSIPDRKPRAATAPTKPERRGGKTAGSGNRSPLTKITPPQPVAIQAPVASPPAQRFACLGDAILALKGGCRWPLSEGGEHWFCGGRRLQLAGDKVSSYCREHHLISVGKGTPAECRAVGDATREAA